MITIRRANERGHMQYDWLNTYHTFSFGEYYDPKHMHFGNLLVINEDYIKASSGFPFHSHIDMEILTYIIDGQLEHRDSLNNISVIRRGEVQLMRAGTGITHSEYNPMLNVDVHLLQIWIMPDTKGLTPLYQQKSFELESNIEHLVLIASTDGAGNSFKISQDIKIYAAIIDNTQIDYIIGKNRKLWIQIIHGKLQINDIEAIKGDGVAITDERALTIIGHGEFILFDLC